MVLRESGRLTAEQGALVVSERFAVGFLVSLILAV